MATEMKQPKVKFSANKTGNFNYTSDVDLVNISIANYGASPITLTINGISVIIAANESFADTFSDFRDVSIVATNSYRVILRGW
jgi:hypothetical protein